MSKPLEGTSTGSGFPEDEDTIELELSAEQLLFLSRAAAVDHAADSAVRPAKESPPEPLARARPPAPRGLALPARWGGTRVVLALSLGTASVLSVAAAFLATDREEPSLTVADASSVLPALQTPRPQSAADSAPVLFANPFDATEVFELPPGTSESEARDAVAELLLQRARERTREPRS